MTQKSMFPWMSAIVLGLIWLVGCASSQPTQFYTLSSLGSEEALAEGSIERLGVGPISLPAYLDRPQVVTRDGQHRLIVADFHQWAEPLEDSFRRVFMNNLSTWLDTDVTLVPGRRGLPLDYRVDVDVTRFDADQTGEVILDARWLIFDGRGERLEKSGRSTVMKPVADPNDYNAIAGAMSQCLGVMSADIIRAINAL